MNPSPPKHDPWRVRASLLSVQLLFGVHYPVAKWIVSELDPAAWACLRVVCTFAVLALLAVIGKRKLPSGRGIAKLALLSVFGVILNQALFLEGISRTTSGHAALMNSQIPTFALLAALAMGQERLGIMKILSFVFGIAGVMALLEVDRFRFDGQYLHGDLLNLANAASYGIFLALSRRIMAKEDPLAAVTVIFFFASLGLSLYGGDELLAADLGALSGRAVLGMVFAVLGATVLTYFLNLWALKRTHASHVALYIFLQPLVAAFLGLWLLGERFTLRLFIALLLVFCALFLRDLNPDKSLSR